ncbi:MAG: hypothetical protein IEMM0002_1173 [bacterium]|nr:MAG: hypothetical protein IEMM0002_1173 [bacterium]
MEHGEVSLLPSITALTMAHLDIVTQKFVLMELALVVATRIIFLWH